MIQALPLVPALPLAGFVLVALAGRRLSPRTAAGVAVAASGLAALTAILIGIAFLGIPPEAGAPPPQVLWHWMAVSDPAPGTPGGFAASIALRLDPLSLVMMLVVTFVGFLIHVYSLGYMAGDEGYGRFFSYMNLFVASMLCLVLADDLLFLYLGWEGVGLCSYLLIGFWWRDPANVRAANKAFIVTRAGDAAMALGLFILAREMGTLAIGDVLARAPEVWPRGSGLAVAAAALLLGGAVGKSAQLPLQTWLPDAMAGPTPVSALIHAATMVTAGVYLIARTHVLFELAPAVQTAVAAIGAATLLLSGASALVQRDIKRVLAYSTISQIGYMFLGLGVAAPAAAIFHFMTHAFFKALLFLAAGAVILALHHEQDIFKMGGLRKRLPLVFWTFLIGGSALAALPLVTSGFYSKDEIIWQAWSSEAGGAALYAAALAGAFLTSVYTFRLIFIVFFGPPKGEVHGRTPASMVLPLVVLAVLSIAGGFVNLPPNFGDRPWFSHFLSPVFGEERHGGEAGTILVFQIISMAVSLGGIAVAWWLYILAPARAAAFADRTAPAGRFLLSGWGFDALYDRLFVRPIVWLARVLRNDPVDSGWLYSARVAVGLHLALSTTQTGRVRWYAVGIAAGAVLVLAIVAFL
jgi:NADH-quinone oxidoreductase subunit L